MYTADRDETLLPVYCILRDGPLAGSRPLGIYQGGCSALAKTEVMMLVGRLLSVSDQVLMASILLQDVSLTCCKFS